MVHRSPPPPRRPAPEGPYDLAIVGGGINGAAMARDAVLRGLHVCLFEKGDFGWGTSSRSSKMLHGGMRYLEQLRFAMVFEALRERALQLRLAPHLNSAQTFVIPVYRGARRGPRMIRLGVWLYDMLALGRRLGRGRFLSAPEVGDRVPGVLEEGLLGGGLYFDGVMDDARLCLVNVLDAREAARPGQCFVRNYTEVVAIKETSPLELEVRDRVLGRSYRVLANRVVRVVGPWTDVEGGAGRGERPLLVPSKGVHLVLPQLEASALGQHGLLLTHSSDGRVFFMIPWRGKTLVGTTETPFRNSPDHLRVEHDEVEYLLSELRRLFPGRPFPREEILATYAGVRPLARSPILGAGLGRVSRSHRMVNTGRGVLTVVGGKYTTYRAIAAEVIDRVAPGTVDRQTRTRPLHGGELGDWDAYRSGAGELVERHGEPLVHHLYHRYGSRLSEVLALVDGDASLGERLAPDRPEIRAEVVHGVLREEVHYPEDFISRRTDLRFARGNGRDAYDEVERLLVEHGRSIAAVPPDLDRARESFFAELEWEDGLRRGAPVETAGKSPAPRATE